MQPATTAAPPASSNKLGCLRVCPCPKWSWSYPRDLLIIIVKITFIAAMTGIFVRLLVTYELPTVTITNITVTNKPPQQPPHTTNATISLGLKVQLQNPNTFRGFNYSNARLSAWYIVHGRGTPPTFINDIASINNRSTVKYSYLKPKGTCLLNFSVNATGYLLWGNDDALLTSGLSHFYTALETMYTHNIWFWKTRTIKHYWFDTYVYGFFPNHDVDHHQLEATNIPMTSMLDFTLAWRVVS